MVCIWIRIFLFCSMLGTIFDYSVIVDLSSVPAWKMSLPRMTWHFRRTWAVSFTLQTCDIVMRVGAAVSMGFGVGNLAPL